MKLYFSPGACSLSPHIVLQEAGLKFDTEKVSLADKKTENGNDYLTINPKGYVPALQLDGGDVLTEGPAIVQYVADQVPEKKLVPAAGSIERYRLVEWLNFISTELHKSFSPLFKPNVPEETKQAARDLLAKRLTFVAGELKDSEYVMGNQFTVADAYLFTVLNWAGFVKLDLSPWPVLSAYQKRVAARPAVQAAMKAEGLIKG
jgi:glutathione S-transferase